MAAPRTEVLKDIPKDKVSSVMEGFRDEGAVVTLVPQPNGNFTVQATWSDWDTRFSNTVAKSSSS